MKRVTDKTPTHPVESFSMEQREWNGDDYWKQAVVDRALMLKMCYFGSPEWHDEYHALMNLLEPEK